MAEAALCLAMLRHSLLALTLLAAHGLPTPYKHKQRHHPKARELEPPPDHERTSRARITRSATGAAPQCTINKLKADALDVSLKMSIPAPLYRHLGITKLATPAQVKAAYDDQRERLKSAGLDKGAYRSAFNRIRAAYKRLYDPTTKAAYDAWVGDDTWESLPVRPPQMLNIDRTNNRRVYRLMTMPEIYGAYFTAVDAKKNNLMDFLTDAEDEGNLFNPDRIRNFNPEALVVYDFKAKADVPWNARKLQPGVGKEVPIWEKHTGAAKLYTKNQGSYKPLNYLLNRVPNDAYYRLQEYNKDPVNGDFLARENKFWLHAFRLIYHTIAEMQLRNAHQEALHEFHSEEMVYKGSRLHERTTLAQDKYLSGTFKGVMWSKPVKIPDTDVDPDVLYRGMCAREYSSNKKFTLDFYAEGRGKYDEARLKDPCFIGGKRQKGCFSWNAFTSTSTDIDKSMEFAKCKGEAGNFNVFSILFKIRKRAGVKWPATFLDDSMTAIPNAVSGEKEHLFPPRSFFRVGWNRLPTPDNYQPMKLNPDFKEIEPKAHPLVEIELTYMGEPPFYLDSAVRTSLARDVTGC